MRWSQLSLSLMLSVTSLLGAGGAIAQSSPQPSTRSYNPQPLPNNNEITDNLSRSDIPTGQGGFAKDYNVSLTAGDQVAIDVTSDHFDTIVTLLATDGTTVAENDDGPDGSTNSLLFARITETGNYIIRIRAFGETKGGAFKVKMTRLRPIE